MPAPLAKSPAQGHIPALDGIRGLAILMVLFVHFFMSFTPQNLFERALQGLSGHGTLGIDLFFMLSGFLITGILVDTKDGARYFRNFLVRRFLRIFPLYYAVLLVILCLPMGDKVREAMPWAFAYLFNFFIAREGAWTVPYIGHFWSLAVEEQFYLVWPVAVYFLSARRLQQLCLVLILGSFLAHTWMEVSGFSKVSIHVLTPLRLNALCLGAWLAVWLREPHVFQRGLEFLGHRARALFVLALLVKALIIILVRMRPDISEAMEGLRTLSWLGIFAAMHLGAVAAPVDALFIRLLRLRPLTFLGQYSYGIYIFHHFLSWPSEHYHSIDALTALLGHQTLAVLVNGAAGIAVSILIAWISFHAFEKHLLKLKDVLAPKA